MVPIRRYLDEAIDREIVKNDSDLARRINVTRASVSDWRNDRTAPNEDQAAALAELLGKPEILAECAAARAKTPAGRAAWERAAMALSRAAACVMVVALLGSPAPNAQAHQAETPICIM